MNPATRLQKLKMADSSTVADRSPTPGLHDAPLGRSAGTTRRRNPSPDVSGKQGLLNEEERFWASFIRLSFVVLAAEATIALVYFAMTPEGPHRPVLIVVAALSVLTALVTIAFVNHVARQTWKQRFSATWTLASGVLLTVCVLLDRGLDSPLVYFVVLPVVGSALALSTTTVVVCGGAAIAELVVVSFADADVFLAGSRLALLYALVAGVIAVSIGTSVSRARLQGKELELFHDLEHLAQTDPLTGVLNHRAFYQRLQVEIDRAIRHRQGLSLIVCDVDYFKSYNDAHGHVAGDGVLCAVAQTLARECRSSDVVARVGGDEFALVLPQTSLAAADQMARRMSDAVVGVTLSMGVAALDSEKPTPTEIFRDADAALFLAKANGRNRVDASPDPSIAIRRLADRGVITNLSEDEDLFGDRLRSAERATSEARSVLDIFQAVSPVGMGYVDREYRYIRVNPVLAAISGVPVDELVGKTVAESLPDLWPQLQPIYEQVLSTGQPVEASRVLGETATDPGRVHYWNTTHYPVWIDDEIMGIGVIAIDVTKEKQEQDSQTALIHNVVAAVAATAEARDPYTAGHQERVARIAVAIASEMQCQPEIVDQIDLAARIHDVGKVTIPSALLSRPGRLNEAEMNLVKMHAQAGFDILDRVHFPRAVSEMVLHHHERIDGSGYPNGLRGDEINLGCRIIAVADVLEATSSHRPYRQARGTDAAVHVIQEGAGTLFDPEVVAVCRKLVAEGRVRLDSEPA
jgi:diguanylate cyclase (GGDEF)-like protein/PAS domain S-box-containing protein